jgi:hypothetical protein
MKKQPYSALPVPAVARKCCTLMRATISSGLCAPAGARTSCGMIFSLSNARCRVLRCSRLLVSGAVLSPPLPWLTPRTLALLFLCLSHCFAIVARPRQRRARRRVSLIFSSLLCFSLFASSRLCTRSHVLRCSRRVSQQRDTLFLEHNIALSRWIGPFEDLSVLLRVLRVGGDTFASTAATAIAATTPIA